MKYMGSKRLMLKNGLGVILKAEVANANRFVDLFTGSGAVANFVAQRCDIPVVACDIQAFAVALARAVIGRITPVDAEPLWDAWERRAAGELKRRRMYSRVSIDLPSPSAFTQSFVASIRDACGKVPRDLVTVRAYGGHYFSLGQAAWIDALRLTLPTKTSERQIALAALIAAASQCAASPGHTAQPFQPTRSAKKYLLESWKRSVRERTKCHLTEISKQHAKVRGVAKLCDANETASVLMKGDVVFIDPPYSGVHYSRFYHVLETICRGRCGVVSGTGRYPPATQRPRSKYSIQTESRGAVADLLRLVAKRGATAIVTFPDKKCSNGISSHLLRKIGRECFREIHCKTVQGRFSTLGGDGAHRAARQASHELIMVLRP